MGRLYDRQDLAWNLKYWRQQETELNRRIANGEVDKSILNVVVSYPGRKGEDGWPSRHLKIRDKWDYECKREYGKLMKTGQLIGNLKAWETIFKACPNCYVRIYRRKEFDLPCDEHAFGYRKAKSDVWWAGEHNIEERDARGQVRAEGLETPMVNKDEPQNPLNKWEVLYAEDKASGAWPGTNGDMARYYEVEPTYKGWLRMILEEEEMTETEYLGEMQRLREQAQEIEEMPSVTDRNLPSTLPKRAAAGQQYFRRDSRHNQLSN